MTAYGLDTSFLVAHEISRSASRRRARTYCDKLLARVAPQVPAEFIHAVTDERRFTVSLSVQAAVEHASIWWRAEEVLPVYPGAETTRLFLSWLVQFRLDRKRLLIRSVHELCINLEGISLHDWDLDDRAVQPVSICGQAMATESGR
jgi:hypothetical protein